MSEPESDATLRAQLAELVYEAKSYLDSTPEAFMRILAESQEESSPGDRALELATLAGLVEAAKSNVERAHQIANLIAPPTVRAAATEGEAQDEVQP